MAESARWNRRRAHTVIAGGDNTSYGPPPRNGNCWREMMLTELRDRLDLSRVHFIGYISYTALIQFLQVSAAHIYLTYPFVLLWSMLNAMSVGALVIGSRTPPVQEVIGHGCNGLLVNFGNVNELADTVVEVLATPERFNSLRQAARETVQTRYDLRQTCLPVWLKLMRNTLGERSSTLSRRRSIDLSQADMAQASLALS